MRCSISKMSKSGKDTVGRRPQKGRMGRTVALEAVDQELNVAADAAKALDFIEAHLFEPLSVEIIARFCNASPFHFSRRFTERQGESVMAYVRGRRLDKVAERLAAEPSISLASLALDCGFETQSAFTRAFTRAFGAAPGAFRRADTPESRKRSLRIKEPLQLIENLAHEGPIRLAGLSDRFDPSSYVRISELWKRFNSLMMGWPGRLGELKPSASSATVIRSRVVSNILQRCALRRMRSRLASWRSGSCRRRHG
jgi:AraC-like DNA-binding protein